MAPDEREEMILTRAVDFFAKHGFAARTRQLAKELRVSQSLIYRYFRSKEELIERVYERNFLRRWNKDWETLLRDRRKPLDVRLKEFYGDYLTVINDHAWVRITMYSGLDGNDLTRRYVQSHVERLLEIIALECRTLRKRAPAASEPLDDLEFEAVWHLHSTVIYYLIRKYIWRTRTIASLDAVVNLMVDDFLSGIVAALPNASAAPAKAPAVRTIGSRAAPRRRAKTTRGAQR